MIEREKEEQDQLTSWFGYIRQGKCSKWVFLEFLFVLSKGVWMGGSEPCLVILMVISVKGLTGILG